MENIILNQNNNVINSISNKERRKSFAKVANERLGKTRLNNMGSKMWIIEYVSYGNITVQFENRYVTKTTYQSFENGTVKNPYDKSVTGVGYLGEGKYKIHINDKRSNEYNTWIHMLQRCYSIKCQEKHPTYIGCSVCEEWLNFQTFAEWYDNNYYKVGKERMEIDKDILVKGNKIYSPSTCVFVPSDINLLFNKRGLLRGCSLIGTCYDKSTGKYLSSCSKKHLGYFNTEIEAFNAYKKFKENLIKQIAEKYKNEIPTKLYEAMYEYEVKIDD